MSDAKIYQFPALDLPPWDPPSRRLDLTGEESRWSDGFEDGELWAPIATEAELDCAAHLLAAAEGKTSPFLWVIYPGSTLAVFWGCADEPADVPVGDLHSDDRGYAAGFVSGVDKYFRDQR